MEPRKLLEADYLDIIFDQRNKLYGGYELRRNYNRRMGKAAAFLFLGIGALMSFSFIKSEPASIVATAHGPVIMTPMVIPERPKAVPQIPAAVPPAAPHIAATRVLTIPGITHDNEVLTTRPETTTLSITAQPGIANATGDTTGIGTESGSGKGNGTIAVAVPPPPKPKVWVEQMPQFEGDLKAYISSHLKYPEMARNTNVYGKVVIQFVVNEDGTVSDAIVRQGIGGGCDEEALRMIRSMPHWKPGKQNGVAVKVFFSLPIKFELN